MQPKIKIVCAYKGLTYLPILLASTDPTFNSRFEVVFADGDKAALGKLSHTNKNKRCDIAICDPLAMDDLFGMAKKNYGSMSSVKIIGCMIRRAPIWIYRTDEAIAPYKITSISDLKDFNITTIKGYDRPNTGWIFCKELYGILDNTTANITIKTVDLNPDVEAPVGFGEVLLTSNVIKPAVADFKGDGNSVIYSYASSQELKDIFFTGIIARTESYQKECIAYTLFYSEIERWIKLIYDTDIDQLVADYFDFFKQHVKNCAHVRGLADEDLKQVFANCLNYIRESALYPRDLKGDTRSFKKLLDLRVRLNPNLKKVDYNDVYDDYVYNRTHPALGIGPAIWERLGKIRTKLISPLVSTSWKSGDYLFMNITQLLPLALLYWLNNHFSESHLRAVCKLGLWFGLVISTVIAILPWAGQAKRRKDNAAGKEESKFKKRLYEINQTILWGLICALLIEAFKK